MTLVRLAVVFTLAELADLASYLQAPHLEANPFVAGRDPAHAAALKVAAIALAWGLAALSPRWRPRSRAALELVLAAGVAWAGFAAGTNVATLSTVAAATRSAQEPAPIPDDGTGFEQGTPTPEVPGLSAVPPDAASPTPGASPRHRAVGHIATAPVVRSTPAPARATGLRGRASWFDVGPGMYAAAGPRLRAALGAHWRGSVVSVCAGRCVSVLLNDWCQCYKGTARERIIDLGPSAFRQLAPLSQGIVRVTVVPRGKSR